MGNPESAANCAISLIHQANYLLDQQLKSLEGELTEKGDLKERFLKARKEKLYGAHDDFDKFLKQQGLKRLENGQVVPAEGE